MSRGGAADPRAGVRRRMATAVLLVLGVAGCASDAQKISAIDAVNQGFRSEYEK